MNGSWFVGAAALFWMSWILMPGVGVTDPAEIFALVGSQRSVVAASVVMQLLSAVFYVPASLAVVTDAQFGRMRTLRWGAGLLIVGAMGSAADAVIHLLAYAMTAPGLERAPLIQVMAFMQGPGLIVLAPLLASFFAGGALLSLGYVRVGVVSQWNLRLHAMAASVAVIGGGSAAYGPVPSRVVGLTVLGLVSAAHASIGVALRARRATPQLGARGAWYGSRP